MNGSTFYTGKIPAKVAAEIVLDYNALLNQAEQIRIEDFPEAFRPTLQYVLKNREKLEGLTK